MPDYTFYVEDYLGEDIPEKEFPRFIKRAGDELRRMREMYAVAPRQGLDPELAESMALCGTSNMQMETVPYYLDDIYVNIAVNDDYIWMLNDRYCPYDRWISYDDLHIVS